ncbi:hypothetical protein GRS66_000093, partial [Saccharomyces pastorianus]
MSSCSLHLDSSEKLKFEIIGGNNGVIRWHLKGNHPIETNRWVHPGRHKIRKGQRNFAAQWPYSPSLALSHGLSSKVSNKENLHATSKRLTKSPHLSKSTLTQNDHDNDDDSTNNNNNKSNNDYDDNNNNNNDDDDYDDDDEISSTRAADIPSDDEGYSEDDSDDDGNSSYTMENGGENDGDEDLNAIYDKQQHDEYWNTVNTSIETIETEANEESDDANSMIKDPKNQQIPLRKSDEDSDADEFFDAEEAASDKKANDSEDLTTNKETPANAKPQEEAPEDESLIVISSPQVEKKNQLLKEGSFVGYEDPVRTKLALDEDNRPKIGLWSVLKSMVGQDLTKLTLPVSFNEPTSLLQRVSEDIEYSHILDQAATFEDSSLRMLYVAAFTASMYASTTNRVSKPFNPYSVKLLNIPELMVISHHPPISATWTESPKWDFYGECNVDSSFNGRTFAVQHLGLWYITIRPDHNISVPEETYSWKKPNNTVIGILMGKPQVDNSGDVKVTNHTTGDYAALQSHGWTSAGAYEVRGEVFNKDGKIM